MASLISTSAGSSDELSWIGDGVNRRVADYNDCIYRRNGWDEHSPEYLLLEVEAMQHKMVLMRHMDALGHFLASRPSLTIYEKNELLDCIKRMAALANDGKA